MAAEHAAQILPEKCSATDSQKESPFSAVYRKIPIRCRTTLNVGISKHTHKHYTQCRPNVNSDHSVFTKVYVECNFFALYGWSNRGGFLHLLRRDETSPPILTRKKEFDLSKRKHGPTIVPALSAKVDNKEKRFIQVGNSLLLSKQFHALSTGSRFLYFCMAMESGGREEFHSSTKGRKNGSRGKPA